MFVNTQKTLHDCIYVQALPGCGKTTILSKLKAVGINAIDGDDVSDSFRGLDLSRGERLKRALKGKPEVILWSYWDNDFKPEVDFDSDVVIWKDVESWLVDINDNRPDLGDKFGEKLLRSWVADYEKVFGSLVGDGVHHRLGANEYVSDLINLIISKVNDKLDTEYILIDEQDSNNRVNCSERQDALGALCVDALDHLLLVDVDHPLSLGANVFLFTACDLFERDFRLRGEDTQLLTEFLGEYESMSGADAICAKYVSENGNWCHVLYFSHEITSKVRIAELISHEVSHLIDRFFEDIGAVEIDTEFRSYYLDWIVGKLHHRLV